MARTNAPADNPVGSKSTVIASLAALGSAVLASSCCGREFSVFCAHPAPDGGSFHWLCGFGFLSGLARQKMQSEDELGEHRPPLDFNRGRGCVYLFPAGNG